MNFLKIFFVIFSLNYIFGCTEKTTYSGKIINQNDLSNLDIFNKNDLIQKLGQPSYIDTIQNKYFYYTEMNKSKNFYNQKIEYSYLFIFQLDQSNKITGTETIDLLDTTNNKYQKKKTDNNIIKRGLIEKIFGGVGPNQLPNSP